MMREKPISLNYTEETGEGFLRNVEHASRRYQEQRIFIPFSPSSQLEAILQDVCYISAREV